MPLAKTLDEAVNALLQRLSPEDKSLMCSMNDDALVPRLHFTLGLGIWNDFRLWGTNVELLNSCGSETMRADDASLVIIDALWKRLHRTG